MKAFAEVMKTILLTANQATQHKHSNTLPIVALKIDAPLFKILTIIFFFSSLGKISDFQDLRECENSAETSEVEGKVL